MIPSALGRASIALILAVCVAACGAGEPATAEVSGETENPLGPVAWLVTPAGPGAATPNLHVGPDGDVYLSWQEPSAEGDAVRLAVLGEAGWGEAQTIVSRPDLFVNWADFPSILRMPDGSLVAHWLRRSGPSTYAYDVRIARSHDGDWSDPITPHDDGTQTEHGFVALFPEADGELSAVWLDGRDFSRNEDASGTDHADQTHDAEMSLRHARLAADGSVTAEGLLDHRVCDCCQTAAALTSEGPIVVYRDRSEEEVRDIAVVRRVDGRWTEPERVHEDGWEIAACPVNGPAIAAAERTVAVAWFTAAGDEPRVQTAFSQDAGASFTAPVRVDAGRPVGRVDLALLPDGSVLVLWLENAEERAEVMARRVYPDGSSSDAVSIASSDPGRASGFPRLALAGDRLVFAWTEPGDPSSVRTAISELKL